MPDSPTVATALLLAPASALVIAAMLYPSAMLRWFQRKRYQYEVTFSLYMLTSTEKFIFNSVLFLLLSLLVIAASLYLPEHLSIIASRIFYYYSGDENGHASLASKGMPDAPAHAHGAGLAGNGRGVMEP